MNEAILEPSVNQGILPDDEWFDSHIQLVAAMIRADQLQLKTNTASPSTTAHYRAIYEGDRETIVSNNIQESLRYLLGKSVLDFSVKLYKMSMGAISVGYNYDNSHLFAWIVLPNRNREVRLDILKAKAEINAEMSPFSFQVECMIVDVSSNLEMPPHYFPFDFPRLYSDKIIHHGQSKGSLRAGHKES